jgi:uncharacterized protein (DUF169 family)
LKPSLSSTCFLFLIASIDHVGVLPVHSSGQLCRFFKHSSNVFLGVEMDTPGRAHTHTCGLFIVCQPLNTEVAFQYVPKFGKGIVNYVAFSPIDKLTFEPDILIITATHSQTEIVMRAMTYSTGELYKATTTPVMGCAWTYIYPYQSGKVNFLIPEMVHGMKGRELFAEGSILISIPYHWIPIITQNLQEMNMHLPSHTSKEKYLSEFGEIIGELVQESQNP